MSPFAKTGRLLLAGLGVATVGVLLVGLVHLIRAQEEISEEQFLLPDLRTLPPEDFRIEEDPEENTKLLRFSNTVWNADRGPLELRGESDPETEKTRVTQVVYSEDVPTEEHEVGEFVYHPDHVHWHVGDFTLYELRSLTPTGEPGSVVASSGKVSFCITETTRVDGDLIREGEQWEYKGCGDEVQGISPGWGDTYGSNVRGQELNIETVPDGQYALRSVADPENRLVESDDANNEAVVYLRIQGGAVREIEKPQKTVNRPRAGGNTCCLLRQDSLAHVERRTREGLVTVKR